MKVKRKFFQISKIPTQFATSIPIPEGNTKEYSSGRQKMKSNENSEIQQGTENIKCSKYVGESK